MGESRHSRAENTRRERVEKRTGQDRVHPGARPARRQNVDGHFRQILDYSCATH
jgi:hypothetical protein